MLSTLLRSSQKRPSRPLATPDLRFKMNFNREVVSRTAQRQAEAMSFPSRVPTGFQVSGPAPRGVGGRPSPARDVLAPLGGGRWPAAPEAAASSLGPGGRGSGRKDVRRMQL